MKSASLLLAISLAASHGIAVAQQDDEHHRGHDMEQMHEQHGEHGSGHAMRMGRPGDAHNVSRTVSITMDDSMRYAPDNISIKSGETVRFFIKNNGAMMHEMVLGSMDELKEHARMMRDMPDMQHNAPHMARIKPGKRGAIIWHFDKPGTIQFGCMVPGHLEGGMVGTITVQ